MVADRASRGAPLTSRSRPRRAPSTPAAPVEAEIGSIAAGGDGVARVAGMVAFVPRTAPGDRALVSLATQGRFARGTLGEVVRASPDRIEPPCPHYTHDRCGGCQLQHMRYAAQLEAKRAIVRDSLQRIGKRGVALPEIVASPAEWRYRRKLTLALRRRGGRWIAGLHAYDDPDTVFDLRDCPVTDERVLAAWREVMAASELLPSARALRGSVRLLAEGAALVIEGGDRWPASSRFFDAVPSIRALWWVTEGREWRPVHDRREVAEPGASFAQVNAGVAERLHAYVVERVLAHAPARVVDAYSGAGDTALPLARAGARVTAIELDPDASAWAAARLPAGSTAVRARVEEALPAALPADVVIVNPPRTGVDERVTATLAAAAPRPRAIVYVSCNPATLARDLARLPGWRIASLLSFDMFPQTAHVETVCELVPEEP